MSPDDDSFIAGDGGGRVRRWDVIKEGDQYRVRMRWRSTNGHFALKGACVQDARGLNDFNKRLLKQRGATGEPNLRLREASTKVMTMASVVSKLKSSSLTTEAPNLPSTTRAIPLTSDSEQPTEQATHSETLGN